MPGLNSPHITHVTEYINDWLERRSPRIIATNMPGLKEAIIILLEGFQYEKKEIVSMNYVCMN